VKFNYFLKILLKLEIFISYFWRQVISMHGNALSSPSRRKILKDNFVPQEDNFPTKKIGTNYLLFLWHDDTVYPATREKSLSQNQIYWKTTCMRW